MLRDTTSGLQAISTPSCSSDYAAEQAAQQGEVIVRFDEVPTYINIHHVQGVAMTPDTLEFTGYYSLRHTDWHCQVVLSRATLQGWLYQI